MPQIPAPSWLKVPPWLNERAPGADEAARVIANGELAAPLDEWNAEPPPENKLAASRSSAVPETMRRGLHLLQKLATHFPRVELSKARRNRLQRLVSKTEAAWRELPVKRHKAKRKLSQKALRNAQFDLMATAFYVADWAPVGKKEITQAKRQFNRIEEATRKWSNEISEAGADLRRAELWRFYRNGRSGNALIQALPDELADIGKAIDRVISDFCRRTGPYYKPEGPVPPVGKPHHKDALKTTVIRKLADVCIKHFGTTLYGTIATLANAALGRTDINQQMVRKSLTLP